VLCCVVLCCVVLCCVVLCCVVLCCVVLCCVVLCCVVLCCVVLTQHQVCLNTHTHTHTPLGVSTLQLISGRKTSTSALAYVTALKQTRLLQCTPSC